MDKLWTILLATALLLPIGCSKDEGAGEDNPAGPGQAEQQPTGKSPAPAGEMPNATGNTPKPNVASVSSVNPPLPAGLAEFAHVPADAVAVVSIQPQDFLQSELRNSLSENEQLQLNIALSTFQGMTGINPDQVERVSLVIWPGPSTLIPPNPNGPQFDGAVLVHLSAPVTLEQFKEQLGQQVPLTEGQAGQVSYLYNQAQPDQPGGPPEFALAVPQENVLVLSSKAALPKLVGAKSGGQLLAKVGKTDMDQSFVVVARLEGVRNQLKMAAQNVPQMPQAPNAQKLAEDLQGITVAANLDQGLSLNINLDAQNAATVQDVKEKFDELKAQLGQSKEGMVAGLAQQYGQEAVQPMQKLVDDVYQSLQANVQGSELTLSLKVPESATEVIQTMEKLGQQRVRPLNNAKQMGIAMHNYHDVFTKLPFPGVVKDDKVLLSWRVHVLPFLEESPLYDQFNLEEPWDSEHNMKLLEQMPDVFKISDQTKPGHTQYLAVKGPGMVVDGTKELKMRDITDGTSNTIYMVTVNPEHAVPWTKPDDLDVALDNMAETIGKLGGLPGGNFVASFLDGSVRPMNPQAVEPDALKALFTISGAEPVNARDVGSTGPGGTGPADVVEPPKKEVLIPQEN